MPAGWRAACYSATRVRNNSRVLREPAALVEVAEDDDVAPVVRDDLPVAPAQRTVRPPTVLDQPRLANGVDRPALDGQRTPGGVGSDVRAARLVQSPRPGHSYGVNT